MHKLSNFERIHKDSDLRYLKINDTLFINIRERGAVVVERQTPN